MKLSFKLEEDPIEEAWVGMTVDAQTKEAWAGLAMKGVKALARPLINGVKAGYNAIKPAMSKTMNVVNSPGASTAVMGASMLPNRSAMQGQPKQPSQPTSAP